MKLRAKDVECVRGERRIFSGLSFMLSSGEGLLLTGANGSGKTSLLRMIAGFLSPASGEIILEGASDELTLGQRAHFIGHLDAVKGGMTVLENITYWHQLLGGGDIDRALDHFDLERYVDIPAELLSAGQKRRLALSRLTLVPRPLWLLDEPAVSLDKASRKRLADAIRSHIAAGGMAVASTHSPLGLKFTHQLRLGKKAARR